MIEKLSQLNGQSDAKQDEIKHTKERFGEVLKKKLKNKIMHGQNNKEYGYATTISGKVLF